MTSLPDPPPRDPDAPRIEVAFSKVESTAFSMGARVPLLKPTRWLRFKMWFARVVLRRKPKLLHIYRLTAIENQSVRDHDPRMHRRVLAVRLLLSTKMTDKLFRWALGELARIDDPAEMVEPADPVLRHEAFAHLPPMKANPRAETGRKCHICHRPILRPELAHTILLLCGAIKHENCDDNYWDGYGK
jgi:hypothetical protein